MDLEHVLISSTLWAMMFVGVVGNLASLVVFLQRSFLVRSFTRAAIVLAVADLSFMLTG